jgi:chemotaxis receptor (MCP) glutamine deamidase CheD
VRDRDSGIGGMNHFMLPRCRDGGSVASASARYGVNAMELLINELIRLGARRSRLEAKVFGGGNVLVSITSIDVGEMNAGFVSSFLREEAIPVVASDLRGTAPRQVRYEPKSGRAFVRPLRRTDREALDAEARYAEAPARPAGRRQRGVLLGLELALQPVDELAHLGARLCVACIHRVEASLHALRLAEERHQCLVADVLVHQREAADGDTLSVEARLDHLVVLVERDGAGGDEVVHAARLEPRRPREPWPAAGGVVQREEHVVAQVRGLGERLLLRLRLAEYCAEHTIARCSPTR